MNKLIKEFIDNLLNPKAVEQKKYNLKHDLEVKFDKSLHIKEYIKTWAYLEFQRPIIYNSLEQGVLKLIRNGLEMNETEIKAIIADIRANIHYVESMKDIIKIGEDAGFKLEKMK